MQLWVIFVGLSALCLVIALIRHNSSKEEEDISIRQPGDGLRGTILPADTPGRVLPQEIIPLSTYNAATSAITVQTDAHVFLGWRAKHIHKQIAHITAQYEKAHIEEKLTQEHYVAKAKFVLSMLNAQNMAQESLIAQEIGEAAADKGLDRATYLIKLLREFDTDEQLRFREGQLEQDRKHKEEIARLEREHEKAQALDYIKTATEASLADRQRQKQLYEDLSKLREKEYQIEMGDKPLKLKAQLLQDVRDEMASIRKQLDGIEKAYRETDTGKATERSSDKASGTWTPRGLGVQRPRYCYLANQAKAV
jgi:hypothetical protein